MNTTKTTVNNFFNKEDNRDDYEFDASLVSDDETTEIDRDDLFDKHITDTKFISNLYGEHKPKLNNKDMKLLKFCNGIDVKNFIKEEFEKNPINIESDENGNIYVETNKVTP